MRIETRTVYAAADGTEFPSEDACFFYEEEGRFQAALANPMYWNDDANMHCLEDAGGFKQFVRDNAQWVQETCLKGL